MTDLTPLAGLLSARRQDADGAEVADLSTTRLHVNQDGRLKVASRPALYPLLSMDVSAVQATPATPVALATAYADVADCSNVVMHVTGTFAGMNCTFEASLDSTNGTNGNWFTIMAVRTSVSTVETTTGVLAAMPAYGWEMSTNGYAFVRVRCTARTSGTQSWKIQRATYATEPVTAGTVSSTVSGTVTANYSATGTNYALVTAASTNAALMITGSRHLTEITVSNPTATGTFVKLYNKATAPTVGTDVPLMTIPCPAGQTVVYSWGSMGKRFALGIGVAATAAAAATDTAATVAGVQISSTYR